MRGPDWEGEHPTDDEWDKHLRTTLLLVACSIGLIGLFVGRWLWGGWR